MYLSQSRSKISKFAGKEEHLKFVSNSQAYGVRPWRKVDTFDSGHTIALNFKVPERK